MDQQRHQRNCLQRRAIERRHGRLDRHRQQPCSHGHQLHRQKRDGWSDVQLRVDAIAVTVASSYSNTASATISNSTPAVPTNLTATPLSTSVSLSWTNNDTNATSFSVERFSGGTATFDRHRQQPCRHCHQLYGQSVTAGTIYSYRGRGIYRDGRVAPDSNVAWAMVPTHEPGGPEQSVGHGRASPTSVSLSWKNNATNATVYAVERSERQTGNWTVIAGNLAATATSYMDSHVTAGTTTAIGRAINGTVGSPYSNMASATVPSGLRRRPTNLSATATASSTSISLSWTDNDHQCDGLRRRAVRRQHGRLDRHRQQPCGHSHQLHGQQHNVRDDYSYQVAAFAGTVASPYSNIASATVPYATPAAPTNLTATALPTSVSLSWTNNATNATAYSVERSSGSTGVWTVIAGNLAATATSYIDSNVTSGTTYSYRVEAIAGTVASLYSNTASATISNAIPVAPTSLTATMSQTSVSLTWTNNATNATAYSIERFSGGTGLWAVVASVPGTAISYLDSSVVAGTFYTYRIRRLRARRRRLIPTRRGSWRLS